METARNGSLHLSRRRTLQLGGLAAAALWGIELGVGRTAATAADGAADEYALISDRWSALTTGKLIDPSLPEYAAGIAALSSLAADFLGRYQADGPQPWADLAYGTKSANLTTTAYRAATIGAAVITPGTAQYQSADAAAVAIAAMRRFVTGAYSPGTKPYDNSWDWDIGTPTQLTSALTHLRTYVSADELADIAASIKAFPRNLAGATGANYTDSALIDIKLAALEGDGATIAAVLAQLAPSLDYTADGDGTYASRDGIHADGSFIQHDRIAYTGTYGVIYVRGVAQLAALVVGTQWQITDPDMENVFVAAQKGFVPMVWNGMMMDSVRGRAISRAAESTAADGLACAVALIVLAQADPNVERAAGFRRTVKGWLLKAETYPFREKAGLADLSAMLSLVLDESVPAGAEPDSHHVFPDMDRSIHRRRGWAASLAMSSARIGYYEALNGENLRGWHTGEGMLQIHLDTDGAQFHDEYWNTVDPVKLPGVLVHTKELPLGYGSAYTSGEKWVGGSVLDDFYGASGMSLKSLGGSLRAKRSWFFLDDAVVSLSSGITATATGGWVNAVLEDRQLRQDPDAPLLVDGERVVPAVGDSGTFRGRWAHLQGAGGYLMLDGSPIKAYRIARTGQWRDVNTGGSTTPVTRTYLQLFRDFGGAPSNQTHAYAIMPHATVEQTAALSASGDLTVIANTTAAQSVHDARAGVTMANFWVAGTAGAITASGPCSVVVRQTGNELRIAVSDPSRTTNGVTVTIEVPGVTYDVGNRGYVDVLSRTDGARLRFDLTGARGTTRQIVMKRRPKKR